MRDGRLSFLRQRHWLLALTTFVLVAAGTLVAAFLPHDRYEATAVVSVEPSDPEVSTQLVNFLIPTVEARIEGQALAGAVASRMPQGLGQAGWDVKTSVEPGSGVLRITVASDNRDVPLAAANSYAQTLDEQIPGTDVLDAVVIDLAARTFVVSSRSPILVSGLSLAVILSLLVGVGLRPSGQSRAVVRRPSVNGADALVAGPARSGSPVYAETLQSRT
jgi:capsular polysaccharide biosynthesis protein